MSFFSELREALRSKTGNERDEFCAHLQSLGIDAQMAPRGRAEEKIYTGPRQSLGVIDIAKGPIHWVNVTFATSYSGPDDDVDQPHPLVYGVPDPKVRSEFPEVRLHAKSFGKDPHADGGNTMSAPRCAGRARTSA